MNLLKRIAPISLVFVLSLLTILPLFNSGFFPMHDDTQPSRVFEMTKSLKLGMFPVRWVFDLGYGAGYPIFNYYAPLAYYFGSLFVLIGFNVLVSTKIMIGTGVILSGVFMYLFAEKIWNKRAGVVSSLFYMYAPYHAVNIFVRGAVGELWAYAFIPLAFYGALLVYRNGKWRNLVIFSLGFAGIILSHNLTALIVTPFLLIFILILSVMLYKENKKKRIYLLFLSFFLGILLSSFYFLPALLEIDKTNVSSQLIGGSEFGKNFVCITQLWDSPWGFGGSVPGCVDGMSFKIGKLHVVFSLLSFFLAVISIFFLRKDKKIKNSALVAILISLGLMISVFLTLEVSRPIWEFIKPMKFIQYPWRFLGLVSFFSSLLIGFTIWVLVKKAKRIGFLIAVLMIIILVFFSLKFFVPQKTVLVDSTYYTSEIALKWRVSKISDEYLPKSFIKPKTQEEALKNRVIFSFEETTIQKTANIISLASFFMLILGIIPWLKKRKHG
ncbi:MAG TPA: 6-pyruvoyl-tetrahydropterin synthase-related protein [Patescibacteria group bacterium]|nr:6-pyruvoyl-tetrahydropterin synthase-related protein [Patescibacteria group bacterium]